MRVLFKRDVAGVATAGQVKDVADGYARNFLLPRGLAVAATPAAVRQAADSAAAVSRRAAEEQREAEELKRRLEAEPVVVNARGGEKGRLYGSITSADVAAALQTQTGVEIDRRDLTLDQPIRQVGSYQATLQLHRNVRARITVDVRAESV